MSVALEIETERSGETLLSVLTQGRLDSTTAPQLENKINEELGDDQSIKRILLVCKDLHYVSSAGLSVFLGLVRRLGGAGEVALCQVSSSVHRVVKMAGFTQFINIYDDAERAIEVLNKVPS